MVLMRGFQCGSIYRMFGRTVIDGCNNSIVPENKNEERNVRGVSGGDNMLWNQRLSHMG